MPRERACADVPRLFSTTIIPLNCPTLLSPFFNKRNGDYQGKKGIVDRQSRAYQLAGNVNPLMHAPATTTTTTLASHTASSSY